MNPKIKHASLERVATVQFADEIDRLRRGAQLSGSGLDKLISRLCANLKDAYDKTPAYIYVVELELPGGPPKSTSKWGIPDPRQPGDEPSEYGVEITSRPNPYRQELLEEALALGCAWAKEEQKKQQMEIQTKEVAP